tara:strand:+ start:1739 stop:2104 length:366 start_codon:yes stop_codon:yes gene_type:complete
MSDKKGTAYMWEGKPMRELTAEELQRAAMFSERLPAEQRHEPWFDALDKVFNESKITKPISKGSPITDEAFRVVINREKNIAKNVYRETKKHSKIWDALWCIGRVVGLLERDKAPAPKRED